MNETTALITLSLLATSKLSLTNAILLYSKMGSARNVLDCRTHLRDILPDASASLVAFMSGDISLYEEKAEEEQKWCDEHNVRIISIDSVEYPNRLKDCSDAPLVLYSRGNSDLNANHIINIVGTRQCTTYGKDFINRFICDLKEACPDVVVVSGLAYGVDICAHRACLNNGITTIGIVAHGHDRLYPDLHRTEAEKMIKEHGAVITEFVSGTRPEARNFLQRNRIIAGMCDATILVESASHGGGLVTAKLAQDYSREVFAVPGPVNAEYSTGCNNLIRDSKASLITCAADVIKAMSWQKEKTLTKARKQGIERTLFPTLSTEEQVIIDILKSQGDCQSNVIAQHCGLPISTVISKLFSLEMQGVITSLSGNVFHLIG